MIDKTQRLNESLDSFLTEYKEKNEGNKYRPVAVGRYGIRTRESIYSKELAKDYSKNKLIFKNTLTVGMVSTQIDIGVLSEDATYAVSPAYHTYRIHDINSDYLRYCLECRNQDMFVRYVKRGSRQGKSIDLKRWITYKIPVYPESVQAEIVKRLDSVKAILSLREQELNALDDLIKARFVEMFESQAWERVRAGTIMLNMRNGVSPSNIGTYPAKVLTLSAITQGGFNPDSWKDGMFDVDPPLEKRVTASDFYMCRGNGNKKLVGVGVYSKEDRYDLIFPDTAIAATIDLHRICLPYLFYAWQQPFVRKQIEAGARTTNGTYKINQGVVSNIELALPPLKLQKQFAAFVAAIDKSKATVQKALDETQLLFDSLMQQYFG